MVIARTPRPPRLPELSLVPEEPPQALLDAGRWSEASDALEVALKRDPTPETLSGLGQAHWWQGHFVESIAYYRRAYAGYRKDGDHLDATSTAILLAVTYKCCLANDAAAAGWIARAETLAAEGGLEFMRASLLSVRAYVSKERDLEASREVMLEALEAARAVGDRDTELITLCDLGLILAKLGQPEAGLRLVDEAMAGISGGEYERRETVVFVCCIMLMACGVAADLERADQWTRVARQFMDRYDSPFFFAECRALHGSILMLTGRWAEAEPELVAALRLSEGVFPTARWLARVALAELRVRQGRVDEAPQYLEGIEQSASVALAGVRLAQGQPAAARVALERGIRRGGMDAPSLVRALELLVEAKLACGEVDSAAATLTRLRGCASLEGIEVQARLHMAAGRVAAARGEHDAAVDSFEAALGCLGQLPLPFEGARARLALAEVVAITDRDWAVAEGQSALGVFDTLGAGGEASRAAAFLRSLGVQGRPGARGAGLLTNREREVLSLLGSGLSNPEIAGRLYISRKTAAHHVSSVLAKLSLRNRAEAVAYATRALAADATS